MKKLLIVLLLISGSSFADPWGLGLITFSLEGGSKDEAMLWLSGFSYSATVFYQRCGGLDRLKNIGSKQLIEILNREYAERDITAEQAASALDDALSKEYYVVPYNMALKAFAPAHSDAPKAARAA